VHMYGSQGMIAYTRSVLQIIKSVLPPPTNTHSVSSDHSSCPQTLYQNMKKKMASPAQKIYSVPVSNKFDILGN
jgi:hypothetical protein